MTQAMRKRSRLMIGCGSAALALGLVVGADRAAAQGIQAGSNVVFGAAEVDQSMPGMTVVEVGAATTVIDWSPILDSNSDALDFLPANATVIFENTPGQGEFAVLNRILPGPNSNIAVINGTVISRLQEVSGGTTPGASSPSTLPRGC